MSAMLLFAETVSNPISVSRISCARFTLWRRDPAHRGIADHGEELAARRLVVAEGAEHTARHHRDARLVHAARGHAVVRRRGACGRTLWLEGASGGGGRLRGQLSLS